MKALFVSLLLFCLSSLALKSQSELNIVGTNFDSYPTTELRFIMFDEEGNIIKDSDPENYELTDNGNLIEGFTITCPPPKPVPDRYSIVIVMDISGSMASGNLDNAKAAALELLDIIDLSKDEVAITSFNGSNAINQDFTQNKQKLTDAIGTLVAGGGTNYNAALLNPQFGAMPVLEQGRYAKKVIMITDGYGDLTYQNVVDAATDQEVQVNVLSIKMDANPELEKLAFVTGGISLDNLADAEEIRKSLVKSYNLSPTSGVCTLTYESTLQCGNSKTIQLTHELGQDRTIANLGEENTVRLEIDPRILKFGEVNPGQTASLDLTITSLNHDIELSDVISNNGEFVFFPQNAFLPKGQPVTFTVSFFPSKTEYQIAEIQFRTGPCENRIYATGGMGRVLAAEEPLEIIFPNGGELFKTETDTVIKWKGLSPLDQIELSYSDDSGQTWTELTRRAEDYEYKWEDLPKPSDNYRVKANFSLLNPEIAETRKIGSRNAGLAVAWISPTCDKAIVAGGNKNVEVIDLLDNSVFSFNSRRSHNIAEYIGLDDRFGTVAPRGTALLNPYRDHWLEADIEYFYEDLTNMWPFTGFGGYGDMLDIETSPYNFNTFWISNGNSLLSFPQNHFERIDKARAITVGEEENGLYICGDFDNGFNATFYNTDSRTRTDFALSEQIPRNITVGGRTPMGAVLYENGDVQVFSTLDYGLLNEVNVGGTFNGQIEMNPRYDYLAVGTFNSINIYSVPTMDLVNTIETPETDVFDLEWSFDGTKLLIGTVGLQAYITEFEKEEISDISDSDFSIVADTVFAEDIDMGRMTVGESAFKLVEGHIENVGKAWVDLLGISIVGTGAASFSVSPAPYPSRLERGSGRDVEFIFTPQQEGEIVARVHISYGDSIIFSHLIRGEGVLPKLEPVADLYDFGVLDLGESRNILDTLARNISGEDLEIFRIEHWGPDKTQFILPIFGAPLIVPEGESILADVQFFAQKIGRTSGNIAIFYDSPSSPLLVPMIGAALGGTLFIEEYEALPGEEREIGIKLDISEDSNMEEIAGGIRTTVTWEKSVFVVNEMPRLTLDSASVEVDINIADIRNEEIAFIPGTATLGRVEFTAFTLSDSYWYDKNGNELDLELDNRAGLLGIDGICYEGGARLIDTDISLDEAIRIEGSNTLNISFNAVEPGEYSISAIDISGRPLIEDMLLTVGIDEINRRLEVDIDISSWPNGNHIIMLQGQTVRKALVYGKR
ncbi:MAG: hypothetical protein Kapaf2KO_22040 [Candidatus Kapaibacteriales bacterium]